MITAPHIRTTARQCEVAWFSALCSDDYEFLGVPDGSLRSNYEHCGAIVRKADTLGYQNILLPSGWIAGQDALAFAAGAMIYVVIEEVIPETQQDKYTDTAALGFIGGFLMMMLLDVGLG